MNNKKNINKCTAGVDEAGRGPLAGPVYAAAVILEETIPNLKDSKLLTQKRRFEMAEIIKDKAISYCIAYSTVEEIDELNIHAASLLAMSRALDGIQIKIDHVIIDGLFIPPNLKLNAEAIIKADLTCPVVSAASILAKTARDRLMIEEGNKYPEYGFEKHKGYPTKEHIEAIKKYGVLPIHRKTFHPVKQYC